VAGGAAQVDQAAFGQQEDRVAIRERVLVHLRLDVELGDAGKALSASTWISLSKWPMLQTMAWSFIWLRCSMVSTSLLPVVVT
jgi:hypothetical protein